MIPHLLWTPTTGDLWWIKIAERRIGRQMEQEPTREEKKLKVGRRPVKKSNHPMGYLDLRGGEMP